MLRLPETGKTKAEKPFVGGINPEFGFSHHHFEISTSYSRNETFTGSWICPSIHPSVYLSTTSNSSLQISLYTSRLLSMDIWPVVGLCWLLPLQFPPAPHRPGAPFGPLNVRDYQLLLHLELPGGEFKNPDAWVPGLHPVISACLGVEPGISSVQSLSHVWLFVTPWAAARQTSLSITNSWSPPKPMSIESVMPSNHLILCRPLLLLPSIFPSIGVFSNESALRIRLPKYWSFSFIIRPSKEHPGLISFRMDSSDLLAVQGALKSLLQHYSSKASILLPSAFFIVQLSHPYIITGKTIVP